MARPDPKWEKRCKDVLRPLTKEQADFLMQKWDEEENGGSLRYKGFEYRLNPSDEGIWTGFTRHKRTGTMKQYFTYDLGSRLMDVTDAKLYLFSLMKEIKEERAKTARIAKRNQKAA